jgi:hypothetical protein
MRHKPIKYTFLNYQFNSYDGVYMFQTRVFILGRRLYVQVWCSVLYIAEIAIKGLCKISYKKSIIVLHYLYSKTNVMHFLSNLLRIKGLYMRVRGCSQLT